NEHLAGGVDHEQVSRVSIEGAHLGPLDPLLHTTVDRVRAAASAADDPNVDPQRLRQLRQFGVVRVRIGWRGRLLFLDQGLVFLVFRNRFLDDGLHGSEIAPERQDDVLRAGIPTAPMETHPLMAILPVRGRASAGCATDTIDRKRGKMSQSFLDGPSPIGRTNPTANLNGRTPARVLSSV